MYTCWALLIYHNEILFTPLLCPLHEVSTIRCRTTGVVPRALLQAELGGEEEGSWSSTHSQVKHFPFSFSSEDFFSFLFLSEDVFLSHSKVKIFFFLILKWIFFLFLLKLFTNIYSGRSCWSWVG